MAKTVIYIDTEDDITSIIGKVKAADSDIVALVPPKRTGMLQSAVNLKLLKRAATLSKKHVVLISSDPSLRSLAGGVLIPTAKNLQSPPEIVSTGAPLDDQEEIVNGGDMPVGDIQNAMGDAAVTPPLAAPSNSAVDEAPIVAPTRKEAAKAKKDAKALAVPDFMKFRKRIFIIGGLVVVLGIFLYWAFAIAPTAKIAITAKTELANIDQNITLNPSATTDASKNILKSDSQELKKTASVDFDATGKKDVGDKASGQVTFKNCETPTAQTIDAGTPVSVNGLNYTTQAAVTVPGGSGSFVTGCTSAGASAAVGITASDIGENYNLASGTALNVSGHTGQLTATTSTAVTGGTKRTITVVSQADVDKAKQQIKNSDDNAARAELSKQFDKGMTVIKESFANQTSDPSVTPAVDAEATKGKLTVETTYTALGVMNTDLDAVLNNAITAAMTEKSKQSIYDNGRKEFKVANYQALDGGRASFRLTTTGYIGSKIDQQALKEQMAGKRYGEIESIVKQVPNVQKVDITFAPFWVTMAPSPDKTTITLDVVKNDQ